jgi:hypothetical protein
MVNFYLLTTDKIVHLISEGNNVHMSELQLTVMRMFCRDLKSISGHDFAVNTRGCSLLQVCGLGLVCYCSHHKA